MKLQCLALTQDATIRQVLGGAEEWHWAVSVFDEPAHIFSVFKGNASFLLIDETAMGNNYLSFIKRARKRFPAIDIMVVGGPKSVDVLAKEKREGVDYYFSRPLEEKNFRSALQHRLDITRLKSMVGLVGRSPRMEEVLEAILLVAPTEVPILIQGESGTGKDVIARTIHLASRRSGGPFEAINCASLAEGVLESELFGHEKGSFTGAVSRRAGVFERANHGTIFLDEVAEMGSNMQVRLLRVLESGEVLRVGGVRSFHVDVRLIAATNRNLGEVVRNGAFRQDLYYRLKGISLDLPPLRERLEDIPILVNHFIAGANKKHGKNVQGIERDALKKLVSYRWPGNVRELKNLIDTLVVLSGDDRIKLEAVELQLTETEGWGETLLPVAANRSKAEAEREMIYASILALHRDVRAILSILGERKGGELWEGLREVHAEVPGEDSKVRSLSQMERTAIREALRTSGGNRRKAAEILGISERTLYRKIKEYGLV